MTKERDQYSEFLKDKIRDDFEILQGTPNNRIKRYIHEEMVRLAKETMTLQREATNEVLDD